MNERQAELLLEMLDRLHAELQEHNRIQRIVAEQLQDLVKIEQGRL